MSALREARLMPKRPLHQPSSMRPTCPRCGSHKTRVRYASEDTGRFVITRHRKCEKCSAHWATVQGPEVFDRVEVVVH
jgi:transcriptional regulator NrdR family protein